MTNEIAEQAALNNALWCDAVCATHGGRGEFRTDLWLNHQASPPYYPDVVTLTDAEGTAAQLEAIADLVHSRGVRPLTVKDSFQSLNLHYLGFMVLFEATWLSMIPPTGGAERGPNSLRLSHIQTASDLPSFEDAWRAANPGSPPQRLFRPRLLASADIRLLLLRRDTTVVGGGVLNRGAGVVGVSNVFAGTVDPETVYHEIARYAARVFAGLPLVGYETGTDLAAAIRAGSTAIGPLRVWKHTPTARG